MWHEELETVFTYFFDRLVHLDKIHSQNVRQVRNKLKDEMEVDFYENWSSNKECLTNYSVYKFVGEMEDILIASHGRRASEASESGPHGPRVGDAPRKQKDMPPDPDWAVLGQKVVSLLFGSHEPGWRNALEKMFDDAHDHIRKRQEMLAGKLIGLRDAELERWKTALRDRQETV
jgi:hypothetical protein